MTRIFPWMALSALAGLVTACTNYDETQSDIERAILPNSEPAFVDRFQSATQAGKPQLKIYIEKFDLGSLVVLDSERDGVKTWISTDGATFSMKDEFLVATGGFGIGLDYIDADETRALVRAGKEGPATRIQSRIDGNDKVTVTTYQCDIKNQGYADIVVGGKETRTFIYSEDCQSLKDSFQNLYWVIPEQKHRIVQTVQWTGDFVGNIATQVMK